MNVNQRVNIQLVELLCRFRSDPTNAGYVYALTAYSEAEINEAIEYIKQQRL